MSEQEPKTYPGVPGADHVFYYGIPQGQPGAYPGNTADPQQPVHYILQNPPTFVYARPQASCHVDLDRKYRSCGGCCCHVRIFAYVIGILELIALVAALIIAIVYYQNYSSQLYDYQTMYSCVASFVVGLLAIVVLFVGLYKQRAVLLIPHIVFQFLALIGFAVGIVRYAVLATVVVAIQSNGTEMTISFVEVVVTIVLLAVALTLEICFLVQVIRCYQYLKEKAFNRHH